MEFRQPTFADKELEKLVANELVAGLVEAGYVEGITFQEGQPSKVKVRSDAQIVLVPVNGGDIS